MPRTNKILYSKKYYVNTFLNLVIYHRVEGREEGESRWGK